MTDHLVRIDSKKRDEPFWIGVVDDLLEHEVLVPVEPDYRPLADALHHALCKQNHVDGCSYYYHQWGEELPDWHPKHKWLKQAQEVWGAGIGGDDEVDYETHTLMQGGIGGDDGHA